MKQPVSTLLISAVSLLIGAGLGALWSSGASGPAAQSATGAPAYRAGPFQLSVRVAPEIPQVGENTLTVELTDLGGEPVRDARLGVVATMRAMGAMPEMRAPATLTETAPGRYSGALTLPMDGSWPLTIDVMKEGLGTSSLRLDMATRRVGVTPTGVEQTAIAGDQPGTLPTGSITLDARRRQAIGLTFAEATRLPIQRSVRAVGRVTYDETRLSDIALRFDAWVGELHADHVGVDVVAGDPLFTVYGPDLLAAQQEYLEVARRAAPGPLIEAARKRLELWGLTGGQIAALARRGSPLDYVPIIAPRSGTVVTKHVVEGSALPAGMTLIRIADLSRVWIEADVYEADLVLVAQGMPATVTLPYAPDRRYTGAVDFIYPYLDAQSRTVRVRVTIGNSDGFLRPEMYAEVALEADLGQRLVVPVEAVVFSGERRVVFEDLGEGRLAPRYVGTGQKHGELIEIVEGLEAGTRIVASGTFLVASESRLQSGLDQW